MCSDPSGNRSEVGEVGPRKNGQTRGLIHHNRLVRTLVVSAWGNGLTLNESVRSMQLLCTKSSKITNQII